MIKKILLTISIYGFSHLLVDALCISLLFSLNEVNNLSGNVYLNLIVFYNLIAFGAQPIIGYICDLIKKPKLFAIIGMLLSVSGMVFIKLPIICMIILGVGNSFFHIGGGIISLNITKNKATGPGLFVAPGAIGVFIATYLKNQVFGIFIVAVVIMIMIGVIIKKKINQVVTYDYEEPVIESKWGLAIVALLFVICVRALIGGALVFKWKTTMNYKVMVLFAVVIGKAFGGILGDRFGFKAIGVGGLVLSAPLLILGMDKWYLGLIGLMLFNYTMPITLTLLAMAFKKYKGFAFGLTTLALVIGYLFNYINFNYYSGEFFFILILILISALILHGGINSIISTTRIDRGQQNG